MSQKNKKLFWFLLGTSAILSWSLYDKMLLDFIGMGLGVVMSPSTPPVPPAPQRYGNENTFPRKDFAEPPGVRSFPLDATLTVPVSDFASNSKVCFSKSLSGSESLIFLPEPESFFLTARKVSDNQLVWKSEVPLGVGGSVEKDTLFVPGQKNVGLYAIDIQTGKVKWKTAEDDRYLGEPLAADGMVFVLSGRTKESNMIDLMVSAYQQSDGALKWSTPIPGELRLSHFEPFRTLQSSLSSSGDQLWLNNLSDRGFDNVPLLFSFDKKTGQIRWTYLNKDPMRMPTSSRLEVLSGLVILELSGGLMAFERQTGLPLWSNPDASGLFSFMNKLILLRNEHKLLEPTTGAIQNIAGITIEGVWGASANADTLFLQTSNGLQVYDQNMLLLWEKKVGDSTVFGCGEAVFAQGKETLRAFNQKNGELFWEVPSPNIFYFSPIIATGVSQ